MKIVKSILFFLFFLHKHNNCEIVEGSQNILGRLLQCRTRVNPSGGDWENIAGEIKKLNCQALRVGRASDLVISFHSASM